MAAKRLPRPVQLTKQPGNTRAVGVGRTDSLPASPPSPVSVSAATLPPLSLPALAESRLVDKKRKQRWTNLPQKSRMRKKAAIIVAMRVQGHTNEEIAKAVGLAERSLKQYLWIAGKNGWLNTYDPNDDLEFNLAHRVVSNLDELLHARHGTTGLPDKEVTLETAKGIGLFKNHDIAKTEVMPQQNILQIQIQIPEGANLPKLRAGTTGGVPAYLEEGEVLNGEKV